MCLICWRDFRIWLLFLSLPRAPTYGTWWGSPALPSRSLLRNPRRSRCRAMRLIYTWKNIIYDCMMKIYADQFISIFNNLLVFRWSIVSCGEMMRALRFFFHEILLSQFFILVDIFLCQFFLSFVFVPLRCMHSYLRNLEKKNAQKKYVLPI